MKQEIVMPFRLEGLLKVCELLNADDTLEITIISIGWLSPNEALACYDYSRTMDCLDRLTVVFGSEVISYCELVATAALADTNRQTMPFVRYQQEKVTSAAWGNSNDIKSSREALGQIKTAIGGILAAEYNLPPDYTDNEAKWVLATDTPFFTVYGSTQTSDGSEVDDDSSVIETLVPENDDEDF